MSEINIDDYQVICEGKARILAPKEDKVFYNPIQQFNRDLSITAINAFVEMRSDEMTQRAKRKSENKKEKNESENEKNENENENENEKNKNENENQNQNNENNDNSSSKRRKVAPIRILEALSATGLRAIRYGHEINGVGEVVANDLLPEAVKSIERSVQYNSLQGKVTANLGDACRYMASEKGFHVIDLDPYGSAAPFIDGAIQAVEDGGMLLITCTDAGVLAGSGYPEKCFALYGGNNFGNGFVNSETNHEAGLRLVLSMVARTAAKYKKSIEPLLSLSIDFYMRVFVRVTTSPIQVKKLASKTMLALGCNGCGYKIPQPLGRNKNNKHQYPRAEGLSSSCRFCEGSFSIAGPMWGGPIHNREFVERVLRVNAASDHSVYQTHERIKGMLTLARNELETPFYFNLNHLSSVFKTPPISIDEFVRALGNLGHAVSLTHAKKNCIKTDAPWETVLRINKEWLVKSNKEFIEKMGSEPSEKVRAKLDMLQKDICYNPSLKETSTGARLMENLKEGSLEVDFETENETSRGISKLRRVKLLRFQENPTKNWGPKARPRE